MSLVDNGYLKYIYISYKWISMYSNHLWFDPKPTQLAHLPPLGIGVSIVCSKIGFVPNPQLTRWHRVSANKTYRHPLKPISQVESDSVSQRLSWLKLANMLLEVPFGSDLYFSLGVRQICTKSTRSEQKNTESSPDVSNKTSILC